MHALLKLFIYFYLFIIKANGYLVSANEVTVNSAELLLVWVFTVIMANHLGQSTPVDGHKRDSHAIYS